MIATVLSVAAAAPAMSQMTEKQKEDNDARQKWYQPWIKGKNKSIGEELSKPNLTQAEKERINSRVVLNGITYYRENPQYGDARAAKAAEFHRLRQVRPPPPKGYEYSMKEYLRSGGFLRVPKDPYARAAATASPVGDKYY